jgi:hypothetical protein
MKNKTYLKSLLVAILLPFTAGTYANETNDKLSKYFDSYSLNQGGTYSTTQGSYWHGGSFQGRVEQPDVTFVRFTPPSISGSCSGIDIFAGSFGLVSGDELVQVARGIAQGAAPYFFNLAMQSICPSCQGIMQEFGGLMTDLNQFGQNSCQQLLDGVSTKFALSDRLDSFFGSEGAQKDAEKGNDTSWLSKMRKTVQGAGFGDPIGIASPDLKNEYLNINMLASALSVNGATMTIPSLGLANTKDTIQFIISLTGTTVYTAKDVAGCNAAKINEDKCYQSDELEIIMTLDTLYKGAASGQPYTGEYSCNNEKCLVAETNMASTDIPGLKVDFEKLINGDGAEKGIIEKYRFQEDLSDKQEKLFVSTRYPFHMIARKIKGEGAKELGSMVSTILARRLITDMGDQVLALLWTARTAAINDTRLAMHEININTRINIFEKKLNSFKKSSEEDINNSMKSKQALLAQIRLLEKRV